MPRDLAIRAEGLGKKYLIGHEAQREPYTALRDVISRVGHKLFRATADLARGRAIIAGDVTEEFWALRDVSFEVARGEVTGVIGRNGAGKSTLLKILSRITEPSEGRVTIRGRVASLLEVGTGFHPELTGRENIYLNGAILGMSHAEIRRKFDEIVAFSEVERFLDTPVKRYSSGMYVRLAFAVAAHLEPEILVVDEVLAVGDAEFQKKCLGKMSEVASDDRTVLFVSHNMGAVERLCERSILLSSGRVEAIGDTASMVRSYLSTDASGNSNLGRVQWPDDCGGPGSAEIRLLEVYARGSAGGELGKANTCETIEVGVVYRQCVPVRGARVVAEFLTSNGDLAFASTDQQARDVTPVNLAQPGLYETICTIPARLLNRGCYFVRIRIGVPGGALLVPRTDACQIRVDGPSNHGSSYDMNWPGAVAPALSWHTALLEGAVRGSALNPSRVPSSTGRPVN